MNAPVLASDLRNPNAPDNTLHSLAAKVKTLREQAAPLLNRASEQTHALARKSAEALRDSSQQLRDKALRVGDGTVTYVRDEPVKALLIAAAIGAAAMAAVAWFSRPRNGA